MASVSVLPLSERVMAGLHREALALAAQSDAYFAGDGTSERRDLPARARLLLAGEALKAGTRLMQVLAWAAPRSAASAPRQEEPAIRPLSDAPQSDLAAFGALPARARDLILAGIDLHQRAGRIAFGTPAASPSGGPKGIFSLERVR